MIGRLPRPKRNPHSGRKPRAIWYRRWARLIRRKLVAYDRAQACDTAKHLQKQLDVLTKRAALFRVPLDPVPALPVIPTLPGSEWVEHRLAIGPLREPVKPAHPASGGTQAMA